ncbi:hypothetical protein [Pseudotabrizicola algicola]|uniref:Glycosyltransferase n=1 Tax=Pseudotabrizicola algicola TaxID=2709381 RepID=A0A6B3RLY8_9RHOB|nr:hypothetical protein [Pseudotabrizicola algicola]NEX46471.1 hypothetical protein [Pseudotabrizicola algicola]
MNKAMRESRTVVTALGPDTALDVAVVIPLQADNRPIKPCLDALAVAIAKARPFSVGLVLSAPNGQDPATAQVMHWAKRHPDLSLRLVYGNQLTQEGGFALDHAASLVKQNGILMTTNTACRVRPGWISRNLQELARADLLCGTLVPDPDTEQALTAELMRLRRIESAYMSVSVRLADLLDPRPHDPDPPHMSSSSASLAFSRRVYEMLGGGFARLAEHEVQGLAALAHRHDLRVRHSGTVVVDTTFPEGAVTDEVLADMWLEPADKFVRRYQLRGRLRAMWPDVAAISALLGDALGPSDERAILHPTLPPTFGLFWERVETKATALARDKMSLDDCERELPRLRDLFTAFSCLGLMMPEPSQFGQRVH